MRADGVLEASFLGYQNGARGPVFLRNPAIPREVTDWPLWKDRLPQQSGSNLVEGGLRTLGVVKTGTKHQPLVSYVTVVRNNIRYARSDH